MKKSFLKNIIKESITDYLSELNSSVPEDSTDMALDMMKNELPTQTKEALGTSAPGTMFEDKITNGDGYLYLVKKAMNESTEKDLVEKKLLLDLIGEGIYEGAYLKEAQANAAAGKVIRAKNALMKENVKKGHEKVSGLEKQVTDLKAEMAKLIDNPEMRGELSNYTAKLEKAEQVLEKLKAALEKSAPKKEKKEKKDDK
jgi:hypothetical protein